MSPIPNTTFVDLNRRFRPFDRKYKAEASAFDSYTSGPRETGSLGWDDLLERHRVVVLGEPGAGKSCELRERATLLIGQGKLAFYVRLDQLSDHDLPEVLDPEAHVRFAAWKRGQSVGYFFLDSVDEAKFRRVTDFYSALSRLGKELERPVLDRARILLSSRITEWKPSTDEIEFLRCFPTRPPMIPKPGQRTPSQEAEAHKMELLIVQLEPLERVQVERLAAAFGVSEAARFLQDLDRSFAWEFARRPLDVLELADYWHAKRSLGSLTEIIEFDVTRKLQGRNARDDFPLSDTEARKGAEWLAAATLFSRTLSFRVPDDDLAATSSLKARDCLPPDWDDDKVRALLNRPIFDSAAYGSFRFHHRRVGEYLAAGWLRHRMEEGCPRRVLEDLLFAVVRGRRILRPSLRPVVAWLCSGTERWNDRIRSLVLETDPALHLVNGDPSVLHIEYRRQVLLHLSRLAKTPRHTTAGWGVECLRRLADPALSSEVARLIHDRGLPVQFRSFLLDMVRYGRLERCLQDVADIVVADNEPDDLKCGAVSAIAEIGAPADLARLVALLFAQPSMSYRLGTRAAVALYPRTLTADQLAQLLEKIRFSAPTDAGSFPVLAEHLNYTLPAPDAGTLLRFLVSWGHGVCQDHSHEPRPGCAIKACLTQLICVCLAKMLAKDRLSTHETEIVAEGMSLLATRQLSVFRDSSDPQGLDSLSLRHVNVRRQYVWLATVAYRRAQQREPAHDSDLLGDGPILSLCREDFAWLLNDIRQRAQPADQALALRLAIAVWRSGGATLWGHWCLRRAARAISDRRTALAEFNVLSLLFPLRRFWWSLTVHRLGRHRWTRWWRAISARWGWCRDQWRLLWNLQLLRSGKPLRWLEILSREADAKGGGSWAPSRWDDLENKRGKLIARATKRGCRAAWRNFTPPLPHENPTPGETDIRIIVGLTGLGVELDDNAEAAAKLSQEEVRLAARYAVNELNRFPAWLESVASLQPKAAATVLEECVQGEWGFPADHRQPREVLAKLSWSSGTLGQLVHDNLLSLLTAGDPSNPAILRFALNVLMQQDRPSPQLADLARRRVLPGCDPGTLAVWFAVWMQIDAAQASECLARLLPDCAGAEATVVCLCRILSGEDPEFRPFAANPDYLRPRCLRRLIPVVFQHVRLRDDRPRPEGAFTLTFRDEAAFFRDSLLHRLATDEDSSVIEVLEELAHEPAMSELRETILRLYDDRLVKEADHAPWTPADIRAFAADYETEPKNDSELFEIARRRIEDLKADVETSDNSLREELRQGDRESCLRRWLQRRLMERSRNRYVVPQEEETDQGNRPDLRLENPNFAGPISVELKWANRWTLKELLVGLEEQLVGKYLRARESRYGIYLLGCNGDKQWEDPTDRRNLDFEEVVELVVQRAEFLLRTNSELAGLAVVGIDFRQPGPS